MENNITLQGQGTDIRTSLQNIINSPVWQNIANTAKAPIEWLRTYYSSVCGKDLTMAQTALLINTQFAFIAAAFPAEMPLLARLACCLWLIASLRKCKENI